MTAAER